MNILFITNGPSPTNPNANIFIQKRLQELKRDKLKFEVFCPVAEYGFLLRFVLKHLKNAKFFDVYSDQLSKDEVTYHYVVEKLGLLRFLRSYYRIYNKFEKKIQKKVHFEKYDLIHAHFAFPNGIIAKNLHKKRGLPYIVTLHGTDIHTLPYKSAELKQEILETLENAEVCIFVSDSLRKEALKIGYGSNGDGSVYG